MQRRAFWRSIGLAATLLVACTWAVGAGWQLSRPWPVREALARVELSREEVACGYRMGGADNEQRCREMARLISRSDLARAYFSDGLIVVAPVLVLLGIAYWLSRGYRRPRHPPPYNRRPSPA